MNENNFSRNLIRLRKLKGLSQDELAKLTGLSKRIISYYEKEINNDFIEKLKKIAHSLNVSVSVLIGEEDNKNDKRKDEDINDIDVRILKKLKIIKELPVNDQKAVNNYLDMAIERNALKNKQHGGNNE